MSCSPRCYLILETAQEPSLNDNNVQINMSWPDVWITSLGHCCVCQLLGICRNGIVLWGDFSLILHVLGLQIWFSEMFSGKLISHYSGQKCVDAFQTPWTSGFCAWHVRGTWRWNTDSVQMTSGPVDWSVLGSLHLIWDNNYFGWLQWVVN